MHVTLTLRTWCPHPALAERCSEALREVPETANVNWSVDLALALESNHPTMVYSP